VNRNYEDVKMFAQKVTSGAINRRKLIWTIHFAVQFRHDNYSEGCLSLLNMTANKCNPIMVLMEVIDSIKIGRFEEMCGARRGHYDFIAFSLVLHCT